MKEYEKSLPKHWQEKLRFHKIKPGTFMMGEPGKQVETTITKPLQWLQHSRPNLSGAKLQN